MEWAGPHGGHLAEDYICAHEYILPHLLMSIVPAVFPTMLKEPEGGQVLFIFMFSRVPGSVHDLHN
jgi:hypothetical protein